MKLPKDTLFCILKAEWFYMIDSGVKLHEYRGGKYWLERLYKHGKRYKKIMFQLGYAKNARRMEFAIEKLTHYMLLNGRSECCKDIPGKKEWGFNPDKEQYIIWLGKRLDGEIGMYEKMRINAVLERVYKGGANA